MSDYCPPPYPVRSSHTRLRQRYLNRLLRILRRECNRAFTYMTPSQLRDERQG